MILKIDKVPVPIFKFQLFLQEDVKKIMADISDKDEDYNDFNRPWVLKFIPKIQGELNEMISRIGIPKLKIKKIWSKTYHKGDSDGWHTNDCNFTGMYYFNFNKNYHSGPAIKFPFENNLPKILGVAEGDVLVFPSFFPHRIPVNPSEVTHTVVTWNADCI
tara:strand:- start:57 stop:539 length:483 start_codon:yes stop_codon:yes gene_type:complete